MAKGTCTIAGCERNEFARGWCAAHYNRHRRTGDVGSAEVRGHRTGCSVEGCEREHSGHGYCHTHLYRLRMNGDPLVTRSHGSPIGEANPSWRGDDVEYAAVHRRLRVLRGRADTFACVDCGRPAETWAYQHSAPDERISEKVGLPFTTDLSHYEPMCCSCHTKFDARHAGLRAVLYEWQLVRP